jgi:hypothetical protein
MGRRWLGGIWSNKAVLTNKFFTTNDLQQYGVVQMHGPSVCQIKELGIIG